MLSCKNVPPVISACLTTRWDNYLKQLSNSLAAQLKECACDVVERKGLQVRKQILRVWTGLWKWKKVKGLVTQSCPTLCNPMDYTLPVSSLHGILQKKNTGLGCLALLQGIFLTQELNSGLLHCRHFCYHLSHWTWLWHWLVLWRSH